MRPSKQESDLEFWLKARQYWEEKAEFYFLTKDTINKKTGKLVTCEWSEAQEKRCRAQAFKAEQCFFEAQGAIEVYTGRKKAYKTVQVSTAFKPLVKLPTFTL